MNKVLILLITLLMTTNIYSFAQQNNKKTVTVITVPVTLEQSIKNLYKNIDTNGYQKPNFNLFDKSIREFVDLKIDRKIITIIDYNLPITENRLWVIDLKERKILYNTLVGHGKNSGKGSPSIFSNNMGSYKSSIGRFLTAETYFSKVVGYALRIDGLDNSGPFRNDYVRDRGIVFHASAKKEGVTYSLGCPSLPKSIFKPVIETIKDGTFVYIYHDVFDYQNFN